MSEVQNLLREALQSAEFGPFFDWLEERGCANLKTRISDVLDAGDADWLESVYFSQMDSQSLASLESKAAQANQLLGRSH